MGHILQDTYSSLVDAKLRHTLVTKDNVIFNNRHDGEPTAGAVKIPVRDIEVQVGDYDKKEGGAITHGDTAYKTLVIDKDYYVNELIDGYEAEAVPDNMVADRLDSAGYSLAKKIDEDCISLLETTEGVHVETNKEKLTKATVVSHILNAKTYLTRRGVPNNGRYLIISPEAAAALLIADEFTKSLNIAEDMRVAGSIGKIYGFDVFESNNMMFENSEAVEGKTVTTELIAGHPDWCHRVMAWKKDVHLQDLNAGGKYIGSSAVQGRLVYGALVSKPETVFVKRIEV